MAKQVMKWVDDDGGLHDTEHQADQTNKDIKLRQGLFVLCEDIMCHSITPSEMADGLFENREVLRCLLK